MEKASFEVQGIPLVGDLCKPTDVTPREPAVATGDFECNL